MVKVRFLRTILAIVFVTGITGASFYISRQLSSSRSVALNAPDSKPQAMMTDGGDSGGSGGGGSTTTTGNSDEDIEAIRAARRTRTNTPTPTALPRDQRDDTTPTMSVPPAPPSTPTTTTYRSGTANNTPTPTNSPTPTKIPTGEFGSDASDYMSQAEFAKEKCGDGRGPVAGTYCSGGRRFVVDLPDTKRAYLDYVYGKVDPATGLRTGGGGVADITSEKISGMTIEELLASNNSSSTYNNCATSDNLCRQNAVNTAIKDLLADNIILGADQSELLTKISQNKAAELAITNQQKAKEIYGSDLTTALLNQGFTQQEVTKVVQKSVALSMYTDTSVTTEELINEYCSAGPKPSISVKECSKDIRESPDPRTEVLRLANIDPASITSLKKSLQDNKDYQAKIQKNTDLYLSSKSDSELSVAACANSKDKKTCQNDFTRDSLIADIPKDSDYYKNIQQQKIRQVNFEIYSTSGDINKTACKGDSTCMQWIGGNAREAVLATLKDDPKLYLQAQINRNALLENILVANNAKQAWIKENGTTAGYKAPNFNGQPLTYSVSALQEAISLNDKTTKALAAWIQDTKFTDSKGKPLSPPLKPDDWAKEFGKIIKTNPNLITEYYDKYNQNPKYKVITDAGLYKIDPAKELNATIIVDIKESIAKTSIAGLAKEGDVFTWEKASEEYKNLARQKACKQDKTLAGICSLAFSDSTSADLEGTNKQYLAELDKKMLAVDPKNKLSTIGSSYLQSVFNEKTGLNTPLSTSFSNIASVDNPLTQALFPDLVSKSENYANTQDSKNQIFNPKNGFGNMAGTTISAPKSVRDSLPEISKLTPEQKSQIANDYISRRLVETTYNRGTGIGGAIASATLASMACSPLGIGAVACGAAAGLTAALANIFPILGDATQLEISQEQQKIKTFLGTDSDKVAGIVQSLYSNQGAAGYTADGLMLGGSVTRKDNSYAVYNSILLSNAEQGFGLQDINTTAFQNQNQLNIQVNNDFNALAATENNIAIANLISAPITGAAAAYVGSFVNQGTQQGLRAVLGGGFNQGLKNFGSNIGTIATVKFTNLPVAINLGNSIINLAQNEAQIQSTQKFVDTSQEKALLLCQIEGCTSEQISSLQNEVNKTNAAAAQEQRVMAFATDTFINVVQETAGFSIEALNFTKNTIDTNNTPAKTLTAAENRDSILYTQVRGLDAELARLGISRDTLLGIVKKSDLSNNTTSKTPSMTAGEIIENVKLAKELGIDVQGMSAEQIELANNYKIELDNFDKQAKITSEELKRLGSVSETFFNEEISLQRRQIIDAYEIELQKLSQANLQSLKPADTTNETAYTPPPSDPITNIATIPQPANTGVVFQNQKGQYLGADRTTWHNTIENAGIFHPDEVSNSTKWSEPPATFTVAELNTSTLKPQNAAGQKPIKISRLALNTFNSSPALPTKGDVFDIKIDPATYGTGRITSNKITNNIDTLLNRAKTLGIITEAYSGKPLPQILEEIKIKNNGTVPEDVLAETGATKNPSNAFTYQVASLRKKAQELGIDIYVKNELYRTKTADLQNLILSKESLISKTLGIPQEIIRGLTDTPPDLRQLEKLKTAFNRLNSGGFTVLKKINSDGSVVYYDPYNKTSITIHQSQPDAVVLKMAAKYKGLKTNVDLNEDIRNLFTSLNPKIKELAIIEAYGPNKNMLSDKSTTFIGLVEFSERGILQTKHILDLVGEGFGQFIIESEYPSTYSSIAEKVDIINNPNTTLDQKIKLIDIAYQEAKTTIEKSDQFKQVATPNNPTPPTIIIKERLPILGTDRLTAQYLQEQSDIGGRVTVEVINEIKKGNTKVDSAAIEARMQAELIERYKDFGLEFKEGSLFPGNYTERSLAVNIQKIINAFVHPNTPESDARIAKLINVSPVDLADDTGPRNRPQKNTLLNKILDIYERRAPGVELRDDVGLWERLSTRFLNITEAGNIPDIGVIDIARLRPHESTYVGRTVDALTAYIKLGIHLDPVTITEYRGHIFTVDGANRIIALLRSGQNEVEFIFKPFSEIDPKMQRSLIWNETRGASEPNTKNVDLPPETYLNESLKLNLFAANIPNKIRPINTKQVFYTQEEIASIIGQQIDTQNINIDSLNNPDLIIVSGDSTTFEYRSIKSSNTTQISQDSAEYKILQLAKELRVNYSGQKMSDIISSINETIAKLSDGEKFIAEIQAQLNSYSEEMALIGNGARSTRPADTTPATNKQQAPQPNRDIANAILKYLNENIDKYTPLPNGKPVSTNPIKLIVTDIIDLRNDTAPASDIAPATDIVPDTNPAPKDTTTTTPPAEKNKTLNNADEAVIARLESLAKNKDPQEIKNVLETANILLNKLNELNLTPEQMTEYKARLEKISSDLATVIATNTKPSKTTPPEPGTPNTNPPVKKIDFSKPLTIEDIRVIAPDYTDTITDADLVTINRQLDNYFIDGGGKVSTMLDSKTKTPGNSGQIYPDDIHPVLEHLLNLNNPLNDNIKHSGKNLKEIFIELQNKTDKPNPAPAPSPTNPKSILEGIKEWFKKTSTTKTSSAKTKVDVSNTKVYLVAAIDLAMGAAASVFWTLGIVAQQNGVQATITPTPTTISTTITAAPTNTSIAPTISLTPTPTVTVTLPTNTPTPEPNNEAIEPGKAKFSQTDSEWNGITTPYGYSEAKNAACGPIAVANILCLHSPLECPTNPQDVMNIAKDNTTQLDWQENNGLSNAKTMVNILVNKYSYEIVDQPGKDKDITFRGGIQFGLPTIMKPTDILWIGSESVDGISHHTFFDGYTTDLTDGKAVYNLVDRYEQWGEGAKCKANNDKYFDCVNPTNGYKFQIEANNQDLYILRPPTP